MTDRAVPLALPRTRQRSPRSRPVWSGISRLGVTLFTASLAMIFLLPLGYMLLTSVKDSSQIIALNAPLWPASPETYTAPDGQVYQLYQVPLEDGTTASLALWSAWMRRRRR